MALLNSEAQLLSHQPLWLLGSWGVVRVHQHHVLNKLRSFFMFSPFVACKLIRDHAALEAPMADTVLDGKVDFNIFNHPGLLPLSFGNHHVTPLS